MRTSPQLKTNLVDVEEGTNDDLEKLSFKDRSTLERANRDGEEVLIATSEDGKETVIKGKGEDVTVDGKKGGTRN